MFTERSQSRSIITVSKKKVMIDDIYCLYNDRLQAPHPIGGATPSSSKLVLFSHLFTFFLLSFL